MRIEKRGIIFKPNNTVWWQQYYAMMPIPIHIPELKCIRIFFGTTDINRFGRISFIDVDENNPQIIIHTADKIVLDTGINGAFDDSGAIPSSIVVENDHMKLYYVGFQRTVKVPYMLFSGLAISKNNGLDFERYSIAPLIDRSPESPFSNAAPFVLKEDNIYKMWFWEGDSWVTINGKDYIKAMISYAESIDGINWSLKFRGCIKPEIENNEFSVGRPWVLYHNYKYKMFYSIRFTDKLYRIRYAESLNGFNWQKKDIELDVSADGWDCEMTCYSSVISIKDKIFLFYNGNNNGETGFGYAEIINL
jgi:hypothetical protein